MKKIALAFILILSMILTSSCSTNKEKTIRIGVNSWPPCEIWYIAEQQGYFEDVPVEIVRFSSWSDNMSSLYVGNIDITHSTYFNSVYFSDKGEDAFIMAPIDYVNGSDGLVIKNTIGNIESLKGKTIGVEVGTDEHFLLYKALEEAGIDIEDVNLVSLPSYSSHEEFIEGKLDALFTYEPFLSKAAEEGEGTILFSTNDLPGYMVDVLLGRTEAYKDNPEAYDIIMQAWYKAAEYIQKNHESAYDLMAQNEGIRIEDFGPFYESFTIYNEAEANDILNSLGIQNRLEEMFSFTQGRSLTTQENDIEKAISKLLNQKDD